MTAQEANKIIAEFMGMCLHEPTTNGSLRVWCKKCSIDLDKWKKLKYSKSLDALVPVWEKLGRDFDCYMHRDKNGDINGWLFYFQGCKVEHSADTIQEAAAIATAKAIKETGK